MVLTAGRGQTKEHGNKIPEHFGDQKAKIKLNHYIAYFI